MIYEYYFSKLTPPEQKVYRIVQKGLEKLETTITILKSYDEDHFMSILEALHWDHPELFYVEFHRFQFQYGSGYTGYQPQYLWKGEILKKKQQQIDTVIKNLMKMAEGANLKSDLQKCRWIHDRLIRNIVYGHKPIESSSDFDDAYTIEGVFLSKRAVCEGISLAFKLLSDHLGLNSIVAYGDAGMDEGGAHAWNISMIDGNFVQIDATWDGNISLACRHFRYDYFALSDLEIQVDHEYTDYMDYPICSTMNYSYFAKRRCLLNHPKEVDSFLDKVFKANETTVYFRINGDIERSEIIRRKVSDALYAAMKRNRIWNRSYMDYSNINQLIFFYKIE